MIDNNHLDHQSEHNYEEATSSQSSRNSAQPEDATPNQPAQKPRRPRGFAAMDRALVSAIARKGGKAAHEAGTAHEFTSEEARAAGRKGGMATHAKRLAKMQNSGSN